MILRRGTRGSEELLPVVPLHLIQKGGAPRRVAAVHLVEAVVVHGAVRRKQGQDGAAQHLPPVVSTSIRDVARRAVGRHDAHFRDVVEAGHEASPDG